MKRCSRSAGSVSLIHRARNEAILAGSRMSSWRGARKLDSNMLASPSTHLWLMPKCVVWFTLTHLSAVYLRYG